VDVEPSPKFQLYVVLAVAGPPARVAEEQDFRVTKSDTGPI